MKREQKIDWVTLGLLFLITGFGWLNLFFTPTESELGFFSFKHDHTKQLLFIGISLLLGWGIMLVDTKFIEVTAYAVYGISLVILLVVLFQTRINGAASWFDLGGFKFQPTELAKLTTALALARFMSRYNFSLKRRSDVLIAVGLVALPALMVLLQNDPGSFLTFACFSLVFYREGVNPLIILAAIFVGVVGMASILMLKVPGAYFILSAILAVLAGLSFWFIFSRRFLIQHLAVLASFIVVVVSIQTLVKPHHTRRIRVLVASRAELKQDSIMRNKEYFNLRTSLVAIGAGGLAGKGFGEATHTKGNHVPAENTDYIFCVWSEEHGFLGDVALMILLFMLLWRIQLMAENSKSNFARVFGYGVFSFFFFHIMINIGMTIGLLPAVGIPLPFFSYGGSSMISYSLMVFVMINHYSYRVNILR
jgi:rod shape determining protein RodA